MTNKKNIVIGALVVAVLAMSVGYAVLAQRLTINGTANVDASWQVEFTSMTEGTMTGATTVGTPTYTGTSATFTVNLAYPGATANYDIVVKNNGSIDAMLESITGVDVANSTEPLDLQYTVTGVSANDSLLAGGTHTVHVSVTWVSTSTAIPTVTQKQATINLNYVQKTA